MAKFGQVRFNGGKFGTEKAIQCFERRSIHKIPLGLIIRKQFSKRVIFRNRGGNGHAGSEIYKRYQDKYGYVVPTSINNTQGQPARDALASAVNNWQTSLTENEKKTYNQRANKQGGLSGYNLYIKEFILEEL